MHECPDCGSFCHCGGDIDDMLLESSIFENHCVHCDTECDEDYFDGELDDDE